jgi:hypothetical protein
MNSRLVNFMHSSRFSHDPSWICHIERSSQGATLEVDQGAPAGEARHKSADKISRELLTFVLNVLDDFNRECLASTPGRSLTGRHVVAILEELVQQRGLPEVILSDNSPDSAVGLSTPGHMSAGTAKLHSTGQTHRERLRRKLQRTLSRRSPLR